MTPNIESALKGSNAEVYPGNAGFKFRIPEYVITKQSTDIKSSALERISVRE